MKNLTINGINYAIYEIEKNHLYLKLTKEIIVNNTLEYENLCIFIIIIQHIENIKFHTVSYLNV